MRRRSAHLACAIILISSSFVSEGCTTRNPNGSISGRGEDEALLKQATLDWDRLFNSGQAEAIALLYSSDLVSMPYDAPSVHGRPAQQKAFEEFFSENENARHETTVEEMLVTNDWAIERGTYRMTYKPKKTGEQVIETGRHVMCRRKVGGVWQIVWEIWNTDNPVK